MQWMPLWENVDEKLSKEKYMSYLWNWEILFSSLDIVKKLFCLCHARKMSHVSCFVSLLNYINQIFYLNYEELIVVV